MSRVFYTLNSMENIISNDSCTSLIESEPSVHQEIVNWPKTGKKFHTHNYNTRFSSKFNKLYVNLSNSRIDINNKQRRSEENQLVQGASLDIFVPQLNRRNSTASQDSREFDFEDYSIPNSNCFKKSFMDDRGRFCSTPRPQNAWLKYFYALCFVGILYIYIQVIHNGELIRKIQQEVNVLKHDVHYEADSEGKFYRMENILKNMKREQEITRASIKNIVNQELIKFSSDKTGRTDFALEASGGKIINLSSDTENFDYAKTIFGITLCEGMHGPRAMLQADMSPGHCWALKGSLGGAIIKLIGKVKINAVTMEHISENISPTSEITSAPKDFAIWGLKSATDRGQQLGQFTYDLDGPLVQTFPVTNSNSYEFVELRVLSNHGNPDFTCVYRFRVHGSLEKV